MSKEFPLPDGRLEGKVKLVQVLPFERDVLRLASLDAPPETTLEQGKPPLASPRIQFTQFSKILLSSGRRYLIKGIIPNVGLVVVWGPPKCGKSFFVFDMVAHIAANWEYRDRRVKDCPVVYFALEGQEGFLARVEAFRRAHRVSDIPFYLSADRIVLPKDGKAVVQSIRDQFPDVRPGVVVLDTLNRSIEGSENDPSDMGQYVRTADMIREAFNCVVIVIHHCGVEGLRPRGHTSLTGAADAQIAVKRDADDNVVATVEFMKDGLAGAEIVSSLEQVTVGTDEDGDTITSCVIQPAEAISNNRGVKVTGAAATALSLLHEAIASEGVIPPAHERIPTGIQAVPIEVWRSYCYRGTISGTDSPEARQKAFKRAATTLQKLNRVGTWDNFIWLI
jgi:hypothetical protein